MTPHPSLIQIWREIDSVLKKNFIYQNNEKFILYWYLGDYYSTLLIGETIIASLTFQCFQRQNPRTSCDLRPNTSDSLVKENMGVYPQLNNKGCTLNVSILLNHWWKKLHWNNNNIILLFRNNTTNNKNKGVLWHRNVTWVNPTFTENSLKTMTSFKFVFFHFEIKKLFLWPKNPLIWFDSLLSHHVT